MSSSNESDDIIMMTPPEIRNAAQEVIKNLLFEKSRDKYEKTYSDFIFLVGNVLVGFAMKIKEKFVSLCEAASEKFVTHFGFHIKDASFNKIVDYMHKPKDSSSLAVTRILFGLAMLFDIPDERGGAIMEKRWGNPDTCHFPLLPFVQAIPLPYMAVVYAVLWCGAAGIMLGYKYRISATMFTVCYWYLFIIEKSYWNNHSYLFGLVAIILSCTEANCYWSIDVYLDPTKMKTTVPYWNYFVLKYQFFILYFMAGMKKGTAEWLDGYSVKNLSEHWVFAPFKLFLSVSQIDYLVVHWFVFIFDLTVAMWMMYSKTRLVAMTFCAMFHLMNSRLFSIGMFPWVCLATMPLYYPFDWPKTLLRKRKLYLAKIKTEMCNRVNKVIIEKKCICDETTSKENLQNDNKSVESNKCNEQIKGSVGNKENVFGHDEKIVEANKQLTTTDNINSVKENTECNYNRKRITLYLIFIHVITQAFLPFSHFITKGYNNWTNGLYGYSWDMMVHTWESHAIIIKVVDNDENTEFYIDPNVFAPNERWSRHGDMAYQYAKCLEERLIKEAKGTSASDQMKIKNVSIYFDVWCSLNGRFIQRHFDPNVDMLKADWSPFKSVSYLMPLLDEKFDWRERLEEMRQHVHSWSNHTDVLFLADFPGYEQEKFITFDLVNVTITVLKGEVVYEPQVTKATIGRSYKLSEGDQIFVNPGTFHKVLNVGDMPAYYMYTFYNSTQENAPDLSRRHKLPILTELNRRFIQMKIFSSLLLKHLGQIVFSVTKCD